MDSSNSGSFQSSSGGAGGDNNDEFDSQTNQSQSQSQSQTMSSFFNPTAPSSTNLLLFNPPNHILQPQQQYHPTTFYNPLQQPTWTNPSPDPDPDQLNQLPDFGSYTLNPTTTDNTIQTKTGGRTGSDHQHQIGVSIKNPKKRTRASRRAPTTVLTTDTTNFRQMVQEFTGIPTAPFSSAAAPFSRRLDLFRPSQPPPFLNSSNIPHHTTSNININNNSNSTCAATSSLNYNFAPTTLTSFQKQPSTFLDLQNPMFSFQSLLQNSVPQQSINGKLETFDGVVGNTNSTTQNNNNININIGGLNSKLNSSGIENINASRSSGGAAGGNGDQVQGNQASWICPST